MAQAFQSGRFAWCMCMYSCAQIQKPEEEGISLCHSPPHPPETGSLTEPRDRSLLFWVGQPGQQALTLLLSPNDPCLEVLGLLVYMAAQQVFGCFFCFFLKYLLLCVHKCHSTHVQVRGQLYGGLDS